MPQYSSIPLKFEHVLLYYCMCAIASSNCFRQVPARSDTIGTRWRQRQRERDLGAKHKINTTHIIIPATSLSIICSEHALPTRVLTCAGRVRFVSCSFMLFSVESVGGTWLLGALGRRPLPQAEPAHRGGTLAVSHQSCEKNPRPKWSLRQAGAFRLTKWKRKAWQA